MNPDKMQEWLNKRKEIGDIDAYVPHEGEKCWLEVDDGPLGNRQCCCVCKHHYPDHEHCSVNRKLREEKNDCICNIIKGYICIPPEFEGRAYSGWPRHGCGCEMFERRKNV